jgi:hypothetical protein
MGAVLPEINVDSLLPPGDSEHPLSANIAAFRQAIDSFAYTPTGLTRDDYLSQIERQVDYFRGFQDGRGRIIDPLGGRERYYATPCYALAAALLASTGRAGSGVLESATAALNAAIGAMASYRTADHHPDFYTYPVMLALDLLAPLVSPQQAEAWRTRLAAIDPYRLYVRSLPNPGRSPAAFAHDALRFARFAFYERGRRVRPRPNNWNVVALSGEYLRAAAGLGDPAYTERHLAHQLRNFDRLGLYLESNRPLAYDAFARQFLAAILSRGYRGPRFAAYRDQLWRGAWTSLFMMSPSGELPAGGRSAHHIWNEAEAAVTYELYAAAYARAGHPVEAGVFKHAARLSLGAVLAWTPPEGPGRVVKNHYDPARRHGYEPYSCLSSYNLLASSLLAVAYLSADESIEEQPCPSEVGGYVVAVESHHKVFVAAAGNYAEYDTAGDGVYNPTGLLRVHLAGVLPRLGPSDGAVTADERLCIGPAWQDVAGRWHRLADYRPVAPRVEILEECPARVRLRLAFTGDFDGVTGVTQSITVDGGGVTVTDTLAGDFRAMRVLYPMLVFDGAETSVVEVDGSGVTVGLRNSAVRFSVIEPAGATIQRGGNRLAHRNGEVEAAYVEIDGHTATYRIESAAR